MDYHRPFKIRPNLPPGRRKRHTAALLSISIVAAVGMVAVGKAPSAFACSTSSSPNDHCYAEGRAAGGDNYGEIGDINISCLYAPNKSPNFVTNELWETEQDGYFGVEVGAISGYGYGNPTYQSRQLFWEEDQPGTAGIHFEPVSFTNTGTYPVEIAWEGNETWDVTVGGEVYSATGLSMFPNGAVTSAGTEYTFNSGQGMRDVGGVSNVEWESTSSVWHYEGTTMHTVPLSAAGPGAWITPSYTSSNSTVSWAGPC